MGLPENREVFSLHAEFCKTIAHPTRLMIVSLLGDGELTVGQMVDAIGVPLANASQHLRALRDRNIVLTRKDGRQVYYRLRDLRLVNACELIRSVLLGGFSEKGRIAERATASAKRPGGVRKRASQTQSWSR
jgi:ArsR family transcriptional regulator